MEYFKGEKSDKVGPGQYNPNVQVVKTRGLSWSQPKGKRIEEVKTNSNVGPGTYEATSINPLYNYKPSSNFASKTMRTMDQRKGAVTNAKYQVKEERERAKSEYQAESRILSEKGGAASTHIDSDSDES